MNKILRRVLIVICVLVGPIGVWKGVSNLGRGAFSGSGNIKSIDTYYLLDYLGVTAIYNLAIILTFAFLGWLLKSRKVDAKKILRTTLNGQFFFIPSFFISLFLTIIPVEGNIKGFFVFPIFIVSAILGIIGFLIFFVISLVRMKKEEEVKNSHKSFIPYSLSLIVLLIFQTFIGIERNSDVTIISFKHENFEWGIVQTQSSKLGMNKKRASDPYSAYLKFEDRNKSLQLKLEKSYHSMYSTMSKVIPVQPIILKHISNKRSSVMDYHREDIKIFPSLTSSSEYFYRVNSERKPYSLYIEPSDLSSEIAQIISKDVMQTSLARTNLSELSENLIIEAIAIGKLPANDRDIFKGPNNQQIVVETEGTVKLQNITEDNTTTVRERGERNIEQAYYYKGIVAEGAFYNMSRYSNFEGFLKNDKEPFDYEGFVNTDKKSLNYLYKYVDETKCKSDVDYALNNCPNTEEVYLVGNNNSLPKSIEKLKNLSELNTYAINLVKIPDALCSLTQLNTININNSETIVFPSCLNYSNNLTSIKLVNCNLKKIPKEILSLKHLNDLDLTGNNISELPKEIMKLELLNDLNIEGNNISELPVEIAYLHSLDRITMDFKSGLKIPQKIIDIKYLGINLVTYNDEDYLLAEEFIKKLGKSYKQTIKSGAYSWEVIKKN